MVQLIKFHLINLSWSYTFLWVKKVICIGLVK